MEWKYDFLKQEDTNFLTISKVFIHIFWVDYGGTRVEWNSDFIGYL